MGENQNRPFHFSFNSSLKVDFQGRHRIALFLTGIAALPGHTAEERYNLCEPGPKKEIPVDTLRRTAAKSCGVFYTNGRLHNSLEDYGDER